VSPRSNPPDYRDVRQTSLAGGVDSSHNPTIIGPDKAADALNVDFNQESVQSTGGALKFNNQTAPGCAIRTRCDPSLSPLMALPYPLLGTSSGSVLGANGIPAAGTVDVPLRGYGYLPYNADVDIGGRFVQEGTTYANYTFHTRQGRSFEFNVSFKIPEEEKLYEAPSNGAGSPPVTGVASTFNQPNGFDEALDECFCIIQKGGDRTAPMSWALAVVNIGNGIGFGGAGALLTGLPTNRPSNYGLVFMWYDAPGWGFPSASTFKYNLSNGTVAAGTFGTQSYRAILIHKYVEPGREYDVAVQLNMDTGTPANVGGSSSAWSSNGSFKVIVSQDGAANETFSYVDSTATATGMVVIKGPTDSMSYLSKYGIRYAGRDAVFLGLGQRFTPWVRAGFIPFGSDLAPLKSGGFSMTDRSLVRAADLYTAEANYAFTTTRAAGAGPPYVSYVILSHQGLSVGNTYNGYDPKGGAVAGFPWEGFGAGGGIAGGNSESLRGYRLVLLADPAAAPLGAQYGAVFTILTYSETAAPQYRLSVLDGTLLPPSADWTPCKTLIQCFRWHQRDLIIGQVRFWSQPLSYASGDAALDSRRALGLRMSTRLDDATHPDIEYLQAYWPCDDAEGATLREVVTGGSRNGFLCPYGNATTDGGEEGGKQVFLSGEGEAIALDLSEDPVFAREVQRMTAGSSQGFGFELSFVATEAFYGIQETETLPDFASALNGARPRGAPDLLTWDVKDPGKVGTRATPRPLLTLSHRNLLSSPDPNAFKQPLGFSVAVGHRSDQENIDEIVPSDLLPTYRSSAGTFPTINRFDTTAPWVGRRVTIQVGIQATSTADSYNVYIAMTPKDAFLPANGDPGDAEFAYWTDGTTASGSNPYENNTYFTAAQLKISRKDLIRSVLCVGGRWSTKGKPTDSGNLGVHEVNARMIVDKVRWFITSPSGALPTVSGGILTSRNGKLEGTNALPQRLLTSDDLIQPLAENTRSVNLTVGSTSVTPPSLTTFYTGAPRTSIKSVTGSYLYVTGDDVDVPKVETFGETRPNWYGVSAVATDGSSLTLRSAYADPSRNGARAGVFRLAGYTAFEDDVRDALLTLGRGKAYGFTGITPADVILTDDLWANLAVPGDYWKLRIYSSLGRSSSTDILPQWTRGLITERRGPEDGILGLYGFNEKVYAAVRGAVYEADDRWREVEKPDGTIVNALHFRGAPLNVDISAPLANDWLQIDNSSAVIPWPDGDSTMGLIIDARVKCESFTEYQTILWTGDVTTDPSVLPGVSGHGAQLWVRLNRGRPELCVASTAAYTGVTRPEKGLYIATAQQAIQVGEEVHIRWWMKSRDLGQVLLMPTCKINGKSVAVRVNAVAVDASTIGTPTAYDWMLTSSINVPNRYRTTTLIGVARDSYRSADPSLTFVTNNPTTSNVVQGTINPPQRYAGYLHSLDGQVRDVVMMHTLAYSGNVPPDFDPYDIDYSVQGAHTHLQVLGDDAAGVGHKVFDFATYAWHTIRCNPFVSVYHELGTSNKNAAWAEYGSQLYVTNGGKPAVIIDGKGYRAGVPSPITTPTFELVRFPLWKPNVRATSGNSDLYDPIAQALPAASQPVYHYNSVGNTYLRHSLDATTNSLMSWVKDGYIYIKGYVRPRSVAGRIQLWRRSDGSKAGGPFLDIVDGKCRFGWYDVDLKSEVYVETTGPVFQPNDVHYVNVRKRWPISDLLETNWQNSYFTDGRVRRMTISATTTLAVGDIIQDAATTAASVKVGLVTKINGVTMEYVVLYTGGGALDWVALNPILKRTGVATSVATGATAGTPVRPMNDVFQVRRFKRNGEAAFGTMVVPGIFRNQVSLTTNTLTAPGGTNATGLVTAPGALYSGAAGGVVNTGGVGRAAMGNLFSYDMVGMYWVWGTGALSGATNVAGKKYRITTVNSNTQITVIDEELGTSPSFAATTDVTGGVFTGIELRKSDNYDSSKNPDNTQSTIEMFGSSIQGQLTSEFAPFDGEFYGFGFGVAAGSSSGTDARCFENLNTAIALNANDPMTCGTDFFTAENYDGAGEPGVLMYDAGKQVWCVDGCTYAGKVAVATSQPSTTLVIPKSTTVTSTSTCDPSFAYLQAPSQWQVQRQVAVAFFDKNQNIVGNAGPQVTIKPSVEDTGNPAGAVRIRVTNLPVAREPNSEVWVYESVGDGSSGALFRVAKVPNGTAEAAVQFSDEEVSTGPVLEFTNQEPPRCDIVETSGSRMIYGALELQPDACVASKPGYAGSVDFSKVFRLNSGFGSKITGIKDIAGQLAVFKRRAIYSVSFDVNNNAVPLPVSTGIGCVAHLTTQAKDGLIHFLSDKGPYVISRQGITNLVEPSWIGDEVQGFFTTQTDPRFYDRAVACLNQLRGQYVLALKKKDSIHQTWRVSVEDNGQSFRYSNYQHPNITALASVQSKYRGYDRMVAGTEEGFVVWLDDMRTDQCLLGKEGGQYGYRYFTSGTNSTRSIYVNGSKIDSSLEGWRGCLLRWQDDQGEQREAWVLGGDSTYAHLQEVLTETPTSLTDMTVGTAGILWESGWLDMGNPEWRKTVQYVDLVMRKDAQGEIVAELYTDFDEAKIAWSKTLDLSKPVRRVVPSGVMGHWFKLRLTNKALAYSLRFELASLVWRVTDTDQG
jgi:hypothetical protein